MVEFWLEMIVTSRLRRFLYISESRSQTHARYLKVEDRTWGSNLIGSQHITTQTYTPSNTQQQCSSHTSHRNGKQDADRSDTPDRYQLKYLLTSGHDRLLYHEEGFSDGKPFLVMVPGMDIFSTFSNRLEHFI